jgi:hypothetical protein
MLSSSPVVVVGVDSGTKVGGPTDPTTALSHLTAEVLRGEERAGERDGDDSSSVEDFRGTLALMVFVGLFGPSGPIEADGGFRTLILSMFSFSPLLMFCNS